MSTKTTPQTTAQLRAALADAEAKEADLAERKRLADLEAQRAGWRQLVDEYDEMDRRLLENGKEAYRRFEEYAAAGDSRYLQEWVDARAARWHRTHLRSAFNNACYQIGSSRGTADLRYVEPTLAEDVQRVVEQAAIRVGAERYDEYTAPIEAARKAARDAVKA